MPYRQILLTLFALSIFGASQAAPSGAAATPPSTSSMAGIPMPAHAASSPLKKKQPPARRVKLVDINSAKAAELKTLPGIGDAEAARIIANRPYLTKAELVTKKVLPAGPYLSLKTRVVAMQKAPPKKPAKP